MDNYDVMFADVFDAIDIDSSDSQRIYKKIVKKSRKSYIVSRLFCVLTILLLITSLGVVYAKDIKEYIYDKYIKHMFVEENGRIDERLIIDGEFIVELNYDAEFKEMNGEIFENTCSRTGKQLDMFYDIDIYEDPCYDFGTFEEFEKELNIKLLRSSMFKKDRLILTGLSKKDGKISSVHLENTNMTGYIPKGYILGTDYSTNKPMTLVNMSVGMNTKYADDKEIMLPDEINIVKGKSLDYAEEYYIDSLKTSCVIIDMQKRRISGTNIKYPTTHGEAVVDLIYNNMLYTFSINTSNNNRNIIDITKEFLDSLYIS